jgi:hypothetical protein
MKRTVISSARSEALAKPERRAPHRTSEIEKEEIVNENHRAITAFRVVDKWRE